jgi:microcystin-dependent protein
MPAHTHLVTASANDAVAVVSTNNYLARTTAANVYRDQASNLTTLNAASISAVGGSQPHTNMQPYLVLNFCIALQGIFPSQN